MARMHCNTRVTCSAQERLPTMLRFRDALGVHRVDQVPGRSEKYTQYSPCWWSRNGRTMPA